MCQSPQSKPRYRTTNWKQYNAALKARGSLTIWLDKGMSWFGAASGKRGRSPLFSDAAIQFCLTIKNLFGLALRQTTGFVQSLLALSGLRWPASDFSTLCRRQRSLGVQVAYRSSAAGLHLLVDSTGIKFLGEGEWKCKKHGAEHRRQWRKLHIGIDAQTLQIRAICVTPNHVTDAAVLPHLLEQVCVEINITVTGCFWSIVRVRRMSMDDCNRCAAEVACSRLLKFSVVHLKISMTAYAQSAIEPAAYPKVARGLKAL